MQLETLDQVNEIEEDNSPEFEKKDTKVSETTYSSVEPINAYMARLKQESILSQEEEINLFEQYRQGDFAAREKILKSHLRLVVKIAYEFNNFGMPIMDLISEGNLALIRALDKFDPERGSRFSSYACWWIRHNIKRAISNDGRTIRLPIQQVERLIKIRKCVTRLTEELDREPTDGEIAKELSIPTRKVANLRQVSLTPTSLNAPIKDAENNELLTIIEDTEAHIPNETTTKKSLVNELNSLLSLLPEKEAGIIKKRYGLENGTPQTLKEVSAEYGITRERIRQIEFKTMRKLRELIQDSERQRTQEEAKSYRMEKSRMEVLRDFIIKQ